ncbi:hypothetical protein ILUMI_22392 [Ignelater luminosus]|uniref:Secretory carrier-associated membrane protein n=1 Tax=Ignelater luminosus TaxID=2038154 RepID=A0A8K0CE03_IGNLU|nr:hypothetical protein ILUMI_22392 [Ignelater luminosus]
MKVGEKVSGKTYVGKEWNNNIKVEVKKKKKLWKKYLNNKSTCQYSEYKNQRKVVKDMVKYRTRKKYPNLQQLKDFDDDQEMVIFSAINSPAEENVIPINRSKNFPPLPKGCWFKPCFYQDIEVEIPVELHDITRNLFGFWIYHIVINLLNVCGGIFMLNLMIIALGMLYVFLFTIVSYMCWFRPAYNAFSAKNSSMNLVTFLVVSLLQLLIEVVQTIGPDNFGTVGILTVIDKWEETIPILSMFNMIISFAFGCCVIGNIYFIIQVYLIYRASPTSLNQAQNELKAIFFIHK